MTDWLVPALLTIITASTPLVYAAVGEVVVEKSGVLNLGVEGMMIVGAISAFAVGVTTGSASLAILTGAISGALIAFIFGFLTLNKTRTGLLIRAVGENHDAAHSIGHSVNKIRMACVLFGGGMAGLGGAYLSLAYTPLWVEGMTSGRGWIALALVVFASWKAWRAFLGAYLFGGITIIQLHTQGFGVDIAPELVSMLPYLATIVVLVLISRDSSRAKLNAPACLGKSFHASG